MRVAVGGLYHETNAYVETRTSLQDFRNYQFAAGSELLRFRATRSEIGGFLAGCERQDLEVDPVLFAAAVPGGLVDHDVFEVLSEQLLHGIAGAAVDGVLLCLHGAMSSTSCGDADGEILRRLGELLGPEIPVVATVDFHANTSDAMTGRVDALLGYDTYPHVDMFERGVEASLVLGDILRTGQRRRTVHRKVGLVTPPQAQYTDLPPMKAIMQYVHDIESSHEVVVSVTPGFPYANVGCMGLSVVASSADPGCAAQVIADIGDQIETREDEFCFSALPVEEAVDRAMHTHGPVVLVDSADNVGGGAPGDGTVILHEWLRRDAKGLVVALTDPASVEAALRSGIGSSVRLSVGAHTDDRHGSPVEVKGRVRLISDGCYVHRGSYATGFTTQMGRSVVLDVSGNTVVLTERRVMPFDAQQLLSLGVSPAHCQGLVVKSAVAWRAAYGVFAREVIEVDTPGVCTGNLHSLGLPEEQFRMIRPRQRPIIESATARPVAS
ncbi:MAG: M81 family metallopeptidase [Acidimicrobiales bacterium]